MLRSLFTLPTLALLLAGASCEPANPGGISSPSAAVSTTPSSSARLSGPATEMAADVTIAVTIADGRVTPNAESIRVELGQTVLITAVSDTADSIHVHGYDHTLTVGPGEPAEIKFTADQPGVFEVETHETHKLAVKLIVS